MIEPAAQRSALGPIALVGLGALCYVALIGGTPLGEETTALRIVMVAVAAAAIGYYVVHAPARADRLDLAVLAAVLLFTVAGIFSQHLRQSLDAVLAALAWACALFVARDQTRRPAVREALPAVLMALSAIVTITTALRWLPVVATWWSSTGMVAPPLDLDYAAEPWGHWHFLALLAVMLYPAWWTGHPGIARRVAAVGIGLLVAAIAVLDGSRMVWIAALGATVVVIAVQASHRPRLSRRIAGFGALAAAAVVTVLWLSGMAAAFLSRAADLSPLGMRAAMWTSSVDAWLSDPVTGAGPGSFSWVLQPTGYFDTNSLAPRHPDSTLFQLLPEAGLLGVAAVVVLAWAVIPRVLRSHHLPAIWALAVFGFAGIGLNPSDFGFLIAVAIAWLALATPHESREHAVTPGKRVATFAVVACLGIIAVTQVMALAGSVAYDRARNKVASEDLRGALSDLDTARSLDPGFALYPRQRGILRYLLGDPAAAAGDLETATELNPADDLAWRSLAMALRATGDDRGAAASLSEAVRLQRSDPTNLLLQAYWHTIDGEDDAALAILAEVVQAWPAVTAAPAWDRVLPDGVDTTDVLRAATSRWEDGMSAPELPGGQGLWLALLLGREDLVPIALEGSSVSSGLDDMTVAVFTCDPVAANLLDSASTDEARTLLYWLLRVRSSAIEGEPDPRALAVVRIWSGGSLQPGDGATTLNPFDENSATGFNAEYRRHPIEWPLADKELPSPSAGAARWLLDPVEATHAAGVAQHLPACTKE